MGYGTGAGMTDLLLAMKAGVEQDQSYLTYVDHVRIKVGGWFFSPWDAYSMYLVPNGSPEEEVAEGMNTNRVVGVKRAKHVVNVELVVPYQDPQDHTLIVGRAGVHKGLTEFVEDTLDFFENNMLGLTQMEEGRPPVISAPEGAYQDVTVDDAQGFYLRVAILTYEAWTRPFVRTDN